MTVPSTWLGTSTRLSHILLPMPRKAVTLKQALPLLVFLAIYLALCLWLHLSAVIVFTAPLWFLLILVTPWVWWVGLAGMSGLVGARAVVALVVRLSLIGVFVMLMAEPRSVRTSRVLSVVYAFDVSDSIAETSSEKALGYISRTVSEKPKDDEAGLVIFGRDAAVELPPRKTFPFEAFNARTPKDGTNIEKGLSLAAAMLPQENEGRIVLISDGSSTEGNLGAVIDELKARHVAVDVLPIEYAYEEEVWLEKLELPKRVKTGETYEAAIILSSLKAGAGTLSLRENGKVIYSDTVDYKPGKNRYALPLKLREPGYYEYEAFIECPRGKDGRTENNTATNYIYLKGEGKVLLVTDPDGRSVDWEALLEAMKRPVGVRHASPLLVETVSSYEFPKDALSLLPYDCVVLVNVPADVFDADQLRALRDAVYNQGTGFLMVGGPNSFGPGGYHRTPVEEALPVTMDISQKKVLPKGALVIILHTCEFPEGNTWGKRIAKEAIRVLGAQDEIGVLVFDWNGGEKWLFPLTPAGEYERLVTLINQAQIGDMPTFATTMQMGFNGLQKSDAATKHMIIISDGDPAPATPSLLASFRSAKISVSTVGINPHTPNEVAILQTMAGATGGRFYYPQNPNQLPSIFIKEAKTLKRSMIQNKTFSPVQQDPSDILDGIETIPELKGYVLTTPKSRSFTVLKGPETEDVDPVLATWRFGLGKTAAFTSDLSPNWAAAWVNWDKYSQFVRQLMTSISRVESPSELFMQTYPEGNKGVIVIEDFHPEETFLEIQAQVTDGERKVAPVRLKQVAPRRYWCEFPLWGKGRYQVVAAAAGEGRSEKVVGGFVVPYSPEYLRFRSNPIALGMIAERTGGRLLSGDEKGAELFVKERKEHSSSRQVSDLFLIALACLIPLDVAVRRVQLDWVVIRGWFGLELRHVADKTLDTLLKRKKSVEEALSAGPRLGAPGVGRVRPRPAKPESPETLVERPSQPEPDLSRAKSGEPTGQAEDLSTTGRLLRLKKKWKKDPE